MYFSGPNYSAEQTNLPFLLKGSAICTNETWVPCPDCGGDLFSKLLTKEEESKFDFDRLAFTRINTTIEKSDNTTVVMEEYLFFSLRNLCDGSTIRNGVTTYATMLLFMFG